MPIFKLRRDELYKQWRRGYFEVEADTIEEAVEMIRDYEVDPYDSEPIDGFEQEPLETEILDEEGNMLYGGKQL